MIYTDFKGMRLSQLGFGTMRLPLHEDGTIDEEQVAQMTGYAIEHGINYFDTAYSYMSSQSERAIGKALKAYPRESFYLATKYPGHEIATTYDPAAIFEQQLQKCGVDYFDFYLLHNVYENSIGVYMDPQWGILDYFKEQKRLGRIKHLGFSCHGSVEMMKTFLDYCGKDMEFCQIQLNYLDWTLQEGKEKCELLGEWGLPIWVMEPVRGGKLANLAPEQEALLKAQRPQASAASWGFRFLQDVPGVQMILSGMSNMEQMIDNVNTFARREPLSAQESKLLLDLAEGMKDSVPCTACRYCCKGCPMGLDIPALLALYNDIRFAPSLTVSMRMDALPENKRPSACLHCGKCAATCPQGIDVPKMLDDLAERVSKMPNWIEICRKREEAAKKQA